MLWNSGYGIYQYFSCILAWNSKTEVRNCGWMNGRKTNHQLQRLLLTAATTVFVFFAHQKFPLREKIILLLQFDAFFLLLSICLHEAASWSHPWTMFQEFLIIIIHEKKILNKWSRQFLCNADLLTRWIGILLLSVCLKLQHDFLIMKMIQTTRKKI